MENKKALKINCAVCDARNVTEELLSAYEEVKINAAGIITSPAAQALLGRYGAKLNCANTVTLEEDVRFSTVNGPLSITAGQAVPGEKLFLIVNGPMDVESGCENVLKSYVGMVINGPVTCPASIAGLLGAFQINGPVQSYPDGAIVLKRTAVLDRVFHLRARQDALYYAARRVIALSPDVDFGKLAEKNVRFVTRTLLVSESLAEAAVPLFDEKTDIVVLPDGCAYVNDDAELNEALVKRYGGKLYINGSLAVTPDSASVLDQIAYLQVKGNLRVCRSLKDRVLEMDLAYDALLVVGGLLLCDRPSLELTAGLLSGAEDGVSILDCANVTISADVTPELLREKLVSVTDCASVSCATREQMDVVEPLARDVASISLSGQEDEDEEDGGDEDAVRINAAFYAF